jgi:prevent-host-death family protein
MPMFTLSSRDFNQRTNAAKRAANAGPVVITDRGRPSHVLLSYQDYQRLAAAAPSLLAVLAQDDGADIDFRPARLGDDLVRPASFE